MQATRTMPRFSASQQEKDYNKVSRFAAGAGAERIGARDIERDDRRSDHRRMGFWLEMGIGSGH
jgi:hypothetical protein